MLRLPFVFSVKLSLIILGIITLFNLTVFFGIAPYDIVWGGRLKTVEEMRVFELVSIVLNVFSGVLIAIKGGYFLPRYKRIVNILIWVLPVLNFLGILGNAASKSDTERILFLPIAILMFLLTLRIALEKTSK